MSIPTSSLAAADITKMREVGRECGCDDEAEGKIYEVHTLWLSKAYPG